MDGWPVAASLSLWARDGFGHWQWRPFDPLDASRVLGSEDIFMESQDLDEHGSRASCDL